MANKRLKDFTAKAVPEGTDVVFANNATVDQEVKVPFTGVKSYVLNGKTVGGTAPGDIVNIDSSQTLTNKRLNSPAINGTTPTSATSAELNIMHGATITTAELNRLRTVGGTASGDIVNIDSAQTLTNKRLNLPAINDTTPTSATSAELNILHGATITTAELNILHGATITTAELNRLRTVGGTAPGDIVNIDSAQTLTNKRLNLPAINSTTPTSATSAELNIMHGATITTAELNRLQGVTDNIQAQLNALNTSAYVATQRTYTYGTGTITGVGSQIITDSALVANTGLGSLYHANPDSITVAIYKLDIGSGGTGGIWVLQTPTSPLRVEFSTRVIYETTVLNQIKVSLEEAQTYKIIITYKVMEVTGV